jgi:hypothetical protein
MVLQWQRQALLMLHTVDLLHVCHLWLPWLLVLLLKVGWWLRHSLLPLLLLWRMLPLLLTVLQMLQMLLLAHDCWRPELCSCIACAISAAADWSASTTHTSCSTCTAACCSCPAAVDPAVRQLHILITIYTQCWYRAPHPLRLLLLLLLLVVELAGAPLSSRLLPGDVSPPGCRPLLRCWGKVLWPLLRMMAPMWLVLLLLLCVLLAALRLHACMMLRSRAAVKHCKQIVRVTQAGSFSAAPYGGQKAARPALC